MGPWEHCILQCILLVMDLVGFWFLTMCTCGILGALGCGTLGTLDPESYTCHGTLEPEDPEIYTRDSGTLGTLERLKCHSDVGPAGDPGS